MAAMINERDDALTRQREISQEVFNPYCRYRPYVLSSTVVPESLPAGRHRLDRGNDAYPFFERLCSSGGAYNCAGQLPLAYFRLVDVDINVTAQINVHGYECRQQNLLMARASGAHIFNFNPEGFSSEQLNVLSLLRDSYHELAPGINDRRVRSAYVFHGCNEAVVDNICRIGLVDVASPYDPGCFGAGCYTSLNIELAAKFAAGLIGGRASVPVGGVVPVVMMVACVGQAYPITPGRDYGNNPHRDYSVLPTHLPHSDYCGERLERGFDCHVACVDDTASEAVEFSQGKYVELVFSQQSQLLPLAVLWLERTD